MLATSIRQRELVAYAFRTLQKFLILVLTFMQLRHKLNQQYVFFRLWAEFEKYWTDPKLRSRQPAIIMQDDEGNIFSYKNKKIFKYKKQISTGAINIQTTLVLI